MADIKWSAFPTIASPDSGDTLVGLHDGDNYQFTGLTIPFSLSIGGTGAVLTASNGGIFYSTATAGAILSGTATAGKVLQSGATAAPSWSTPTYPSASGTSGTILRSDGTNNIYSTSTFADTYTASSLLYSNGANTVTGLTTANSSVLVTNSAGVPIWSSTMTNGQIIIGSTGATPIAASLTAGTGINITNAAGSITISSSGSGLSWSTIAGTTQAAAVDSGYVIGNALQTTVTLPATAPIGSTVTILGDGAAGWILQGNTGQTIRIGSQVTSSAGTLTSANQYDNVTVQCLTADTVWMVTSVISTGLTVA